MGMSDKIFETDKEPTQEVAEEVSISEVEPKKTKGKHKKEMTPERKKILCEQLKKAREASALKRGTKAKEKKLKKLKEVESEVENSIIENIKKKTQITPTAKEPSISNEEMESKIEKRLRLKIENEYSHKYKDDKIELLKSQ